MPLHIKAYIFVIVISTVVFMFLRTPVTASLIDRDEFVRRRNAWLAITTAAFLSHSYVVYAFAAGVIMWLLMQRDRNPLAAYVSVLFAVPLLKYVIPGFGVVQSLFVLDHQRLLCLVVLLPIAFRMIQRREAVDPTVRVVWWFAFAYYLQIILNYFFEYSLTITMRMVVMDGLTWLLPLYVAMRVSASVRAIRETMVMYVMAMCVLAAIAMLEVARGWLFFESLRGPLGVHFEATTAYLTRDGAFGSLLRSNVTAGHSIILGMMMMVGVCFWIALRDNLGKRWQSLSVLGLVVIGLLASLSRGPWVGAVAGVLVAVLAGPKLLKRVMMLVVVCMVVILALSVLPFGQKVLQYVPFMGEVGSETVDYRKQLFEVSMIVFWDSPIFGNFQAMMDPRLEQMRQGQGIIDMVNSYLGIGLHHGFVGIFLFLAPSLYAMYKVYHVSREVEGYNAAVGVTGRAILGAKASMLITIATASFMDFAPVLHWLLVGMAVNYVVVARRVIAQHHAAQMQARRHQRAGASSDEPLRPVSAIPR